MTPPISPAPVRSLAGDRLPAYVSNGVVALRLPSIPWLGRLPGDIRIERPGFRFYLPITSCLLISGLVSLGYWLFARVR